MGGKQQLGDYMIKISGGLLAAAAMTLLAPSAFADGVMLEANGARAQDRWGGELGLGYTLDAGGFSIRPIGGVFVHAGDDDRYERDTFRNGQSRCRDTETGQFASDSKCTNLDVKWYAKLEATYTIPLGPEIGGGARFSSEKLRPYGTIGFGLGPNLRLKGNVGANYYAAGIKAQF